MLCSGVLGAAMFSRVFLGCFIITRALSICISAECMLPHSYPCLHHYYDNRRCAFVVHALGGGAVCMSDLIGHTIASSCGCTLQGSCLDALAVSVLTGVMPVPWGRHVGPVNVANATAGYVISWASGSCSIWASVSAVLLGVWGAVEHAVVVVLVCTADHSAELPRPIVIVIMALTTGGISKGAQLLCEPQRSS
jgi:hypothetical protein